jgi:hypothetical protein
LIGPLPPLVLLEDANDLADFLEFTRRTIPRAKWAEESIIAAREARIEGMI